MLAYDPVERITAEEALDHPYFASINRSAYASREYWCCPIYFRHFEFMDFSIDGEEVSHSPRTQEKPANTQILEKVRVDRSRYSISLLSNRSHNLINNHLRMNRKRKYKDAVSFFHLHSTKNISKWANKRLCSASS